MHSRSACALTSGFFLDLKRAFFEKNMECINAIFYLVINSGFSNYTTIYLPIRATSLQWPVSFFLKVAVVERFNCSYIGPSEYK